MTAYILALLIGLTLGILGGGGSILTVPVLVYLLDFEPKLAIAMSLIIVGLTSLFGGTRQLLKKNVDLKAALIFSPLSIIGTFFGSKIAAIMSSQLQLIIFAIVMLLAAILMLKDKKESNSKSSPSYKIIILASATVGVITGIVGVGGGFLIVPALTVLLNIPIKKSIGTSLIIITLNSISGVIGYLNQFEFDWKFLSIFSLCSITGVLIGGELVRFVPQKVLKRGFAFFIILMGVFILYKNTFL